MYDREERNTFESVYLEDRKQGENTEINLTETLYSRIVCDSNVWYLLCFIFGLHCHSIDENKCFIPMVQISLFHTLRYMSY